MKSMNFEKLKSKIRTLSTRGNFNKASNELEKEIFSLSKDEIIPLITEIGTIPECIEADSTRRKIIYKSFRYFISKSLAGIGSKSTSIQRAIGRS